MIHLLKTQTYWLSVGLNYVSPVFSYPSYFSIPTRIGYCHRELFPWGGSDGKESAYNAGDLGSIPRLSSIPGLGAIPGWEDPQEKEMATLSSILAWRIPWTEEPGELQSINSQTVRHD